MRLYRVSATGDYFHHQSKAVWVGAKSEIPQAKRIVQEAVANGDLHTGPEVTEFDVPTDKRGLLSFLNNHANLTV